jgi:capsule polysaccharide export protein KpsE/RkpR
VKQDLDATSGRLSQFSSKNATLDVQTQGKAMIEAAARLQGELIAAETQLSGLQAIYTNENVRVRSTQARIAELRTQLRKFRGVAGEPTPGEGDADQLYPSVRELPLLGVTYYDLYRQMKIEEAVYEFLTKQCELAKVQEAKEIPVVKVMDAPDVAEKRSFPPRLAIIILTTLLAFSGGVAWLAGVSLWHRAQDSVE